MHNLPHDGEAKLSLASDFGTTPNIKAISYLEQTVIHEKQHQR